MGLCHITEGSGPDLVILHGWSQNAGVWHAVMPALRDKYRVHLIELPGHGASPMVDQADELDAWVEAVLDAAPVQAFWLGWSLGGLLAQRAALLAPERIQGLCLVTTAPRFVATADWPYGITQAAFEQFADLLMTDSTATVKRFLTLQVQGGAHARAALNQLIAALSQRPEADIKGLKAGLHLLLSTDLRDGLPQLSVPASWLWGGKDTIATASIADAVAQLAPDSKTTVFDKAAHAPFISHFAASMQWLEEALAC